MTPSFQSIDPTQIQKLAVLAQTSFRDTYAPFNPESRVTGYLANHLQAEHFAAHLKRPNSWLWGAFMGDEVIAYAQFAASPPPQEVASGSPVELMRFYFDRAYHGQGMARPFMRFCETAMAQLGFDRVWLGVWEHNKRAQAFYQKCGYRDVGRIMFLFEDDPQTDYLMTRALPGITR